MDEEREEQLQYASSMTFSRPRWLLAGASIVASESCQIAKYGRKGLAPRGLAARQEVCPRVFFDIG